MPNRVIASLVLVTGLFALSIQAPAQDSADTEDPRFLVVYDSSNSMWGELADKSRKYEAGRSALAALLEEDFAAREIGFRAYGHRSKSDCRDSELVVPFAGIDTAKAPITQAVGDIRPTGKTPITYSLQEGLKDFDGRQGDILLISDGIETCDADPCELMREWRASNVNIRVHVVGVGLNEMERLAMSCIADESGGTYFDADTAGGFAQAMTEASVAIEVPKGDPEPVDQSQGYALIIKATDDQGRSYIANGKLFKDGEEVDTITTHGRNVLDEPGDYEMEIGAVLRDGTIYEPVRVAVSVSEPGETRTQVTVVAPARVNATFFEDGEEHRGSHVTAYQNGEEVFSFRAIDEALARPGTYEFKATPNKDNPLAQTAALSEGELTELVFELVTTIKVYVALKMPDGKLIYRGSELWRDGEKLYSVRGKNGGLVRPGKYQLRSEHQNTPLTPVEVEFSTEGQTVEVPLDVGFVTITYAPSDNDYIRKADRANLESLDRGGSSFARPNIAIPITPGRYQVNPQTAAGFFEPQQFQVASNETVEVAFTPAPLGDVVVDYAPSENYLKTPDRASVTPLDGQKIANGFMRPGVAKKFLPGRYKVRPDGYAGDIAEQEFEVKAGETTRITLKLRNEE